MKTNWKAIVAALVASFVANLAGVMLFFDPIAKADNSARQIGHPAVGLLVYVALTVGIFHWTAKQIGNAYKAAFIIGASQFVLASVDMVLTGKRGIMTGAASAVLVFITWSAVAFAYSYFSKKKSSD